jgi:hypothetical protein
MFKEVGGMDGDIPCNVRVTGLPVIVVSGSPTVCATATFALTKNKMIPTNFNKKRTPKNQVNLWLRVPRQH